MAKPFCLSSMPITQNELGFSVNLGSDQTQQEAITPAHYKLTATRAFPTLQLHVLYIPTKSELILTNNVHSNCGYHKDAENYNLC